MVKRTKQEQRLDCQTCGRINEARTVAIFTPPTSDCPFSMNGGRGVICLDCYTKRAVTAQNGGY